ncbi:MAG: hypothetical protein PHU12_01505 [Candidatus Aenigmarchaeota archaeon]|nr:hypothetical protein [Candidatus Aenigmarchaeota archaeon]
MEEPFLYGMEGDICDLLLYGAASIETIYSFLYDNKKSVETIYPKKPLENRKKLDNLLLKLIKKGIISEQADGHIELTPDAKKIFK